MAVISDRTITGTINACRSGRFPNTGLQAEQRLARNRRRLTTFVGTLPVIAMRTHLNHHSFYPILAQRLEKLLRMPSDSLEIDVLRSRTFRKETSLCRLLRFGTPWLILKAYSEQDIGHQSLRAMRESEGGRSFAGIHGVDSTHPETIFAISGPNLPKYNVVVAETIVPGMPAVNYLELAANMGLAGERAALLYTMRLAFERSAEMLVLVHRMRHGDAIVRFEKIFREAHELLDLLAESGAISPVETARIRRALDLNGRDITEARVTLAHRDYTTNNLMYHGEEERMGVIDLEKSEMEYYGKDLAKFTESLFVDGKAIGLTDSEIYAIERAFLDTYRGITGKHHRRYWGMYRFYQIYTALSLANYHSKHPQQGRFGIMKERILSIA